MKRLLIFALIAALLLTFTVACGDQSKKNDETSVQTSDNPPVNPSVKDNDGSRSNGEDKSSQKSLDFGGEGDPNVISWD